MNLYHYHPETFEYIGPSIADTDPYDPDWFIKPAFSTEVAPPDPIVGSARLFKNGTWVYEEDHRGATIYNTQTQERSTVIDLGPIPPGWTDIEPFENSKWDAQTGSWVTDEAKINDILKMQAQATLDKSDITVLRCVEKTVFVPEEWQVYRESLREIVSGSSSATELPVRPPYPDGT